MAWTVSGTVSLTNNNPIVYGAGTTWAASNLVRGGDIFKAPDGKDYQVLSVQSNTQLTLATPYLGSTASGQVYALVHTGLLPAELAVDVSELQSKYLATVSQLYEWETSTATSVPLTNPATGVTTNVTPLGYLLTDLPGDFIAARDDAEESKNAAITAAATAENYAELAIEAWSASTEPNETLASISRTLHSGIIVKLLIYDTSKDSDPTWPDRCTATSWYNEALGFTGKWLGQVATTAAAWAISGAAAGDGFQNSTDKKYYVLTGTSTATEIFRGNKRGFPAKVAIVAAGVGRVVIYDLTQAGCPMWMVFVCAAGNVLSSNVSLTSLAACNGTLAVGLGSTQGVSLIQFVEDVARIVVNAGLYKYEGFLSGRNATDGNQLIAATPAIVNNTVNDVAITVLPTAPTDSCFVGETLVTLSNGLSKRIDQIEIGDVVNTLEGGSTVTRWVDNGVKDVISLDFGVTKITCTPEHKIRTTVGWVEAQHITKDHEVVHES